jgi:hypothetical protein
MESPTPKGVGVEPNKPADEASGEAPTPGGGSSGVPEHVVAAQRQKRRELEEKVAALQEREREWQQRYVSAIEQQQKANAQAQEQAAARVPSDWEDLDDDERRVRLLEQRLDSEAQKREQTATELRQLRLEREVADAIRAANNRAEQDGIPVRVDADDIYSKMITGNFSSVEDAVKAVYNREFEKYETIRSQEQERMRSAANAASNTGEPEGKLPTATPPTPVDWEDVNTDDLFAVAERNLLEAMQRSKQ